MKVAIILSFLIITIIGYVLYFTSKNRKVVKYGYLSGLIFSICFTTSASSFEISEKWVEKEVEIIYNDRLILVDDGEKLWESDLSNKSNILKKDTRFQFRIVTNLWGTERSDEFRIIYNKNI